MSRTYGSNNKTPVQDTKQGRVYPNGQFIPPTPERKTLSDLHPQLKNKGAGGTAQQRPSSGQPLTTTTRTQSYNDLKNSATAANGSYGRFAKGTQNQLDEAEKRRQEYLKSGSSSGRLPTYVSKLGQGLKYAAVAHTDQPTEVDLEKAINDRINELLRGKTPTSIPLIDSKEEEFVTFEIKIGDQGLLKKIEQWNQRNVKFPIVVKNDSIIISRTASGRFNLKHVVEENDNGSNDLTIAQNEITSLDEIIFDAVNKASTISNYTQYSHLELDEEISHDGPDLISTSEPTSPQQSYGNLPQSPIEADQRIEETPAIGSSTTQINFLTPENLNLEEHRKLLYRIESAIFSKIKEADKILEFESARIKFVLKEQEVWATFQDGVLTFDDEGWTDRKRNLTFKKPSEEDIKAILEGKASEVLSIPKFTKQQKSGFNTYVKGDNQSNSPLLTLMGNDQTSTRNAIKNCIEGKDRQQGEATGSSSKKDKLKDAPNSFYKNFQRRNANDITAEAEYGVSFRYSENGSQSNGGTLWLYKLVEDENGELKQGQIISRFSRFFGSVQGFEKALTQYLHRAQPFSTQTKLHTKFGIPKRASRSTSAEDSASDSERSDTPVKTKETSEHKIRRLEKEVKRYSDQFVEAANESAEYKIKILAFEREIKDTCDEISVLKNKINGLTEQNGQLSQDLGEKEAKINEISDSLTEKEQQLTDLGKRLLIAQTLKETLEKQNTEKLTKIQEGNKKIEDLVKRNSELQESRQALEEEKKELDVTNAELLKKLRVAKSEIGQLEQEKFLREKEVVELTAARDELRTQAPVLISANQTLRDQLDGLRKQLEAAQNELATKSREFERQKQSLEGQLEEANTAKAKIQASLTTAREQLRGLQATEAQLTQAQQTNRNLQSKNSTLQTQNERLQQEKQNLEADNNSLQRQNTVLQEQVAVIDKEKAELQTRIAQAEADLRSKDDEISSLKQRNAELSRGQVGLTALQSKLAESETKLAGANAELETLRSQLQSQQQTIKQQQAEIEQRNSAIARLEEDSQTKEGLIRDKDAEIAAKLEELTAKDGQLQERQRDLEGKERELSQLQQSQTVLEREKAAAVTQASAAQAKVAALEATAATNGEKLAALQQQLQDEKTAKNTLSGEKRRLELELDNKITELEDLRTSLTRAQASSTKTQGELGQQNQDLRQEIQDKELKILALEAQIASNQQELERITKQNTEALEAARSAQEDQIQAAQQAVQDAQEQQQRISDELAQAREQLAAAQQQVSEIQEEAERNLRLIEELQAKAERLQGVVSAAEQQKTEAQRNLAKTQQALVGAQAEKEAAMAKNRENEQKIAGLQQQINSQTQQQPTRVEQPKIANEKGRVFFSLEGQDRENSVSQSSSSAAAVEEFQAENLQSQSEGKYKFSQIQLISDQDVKDKKVTSEIYSQIFAPLVLQAAQSAGLVSSHRQDISQLNDFEKEQLAALILVAKLHNGLGNDRNEGKIKYDFAKSLPGQTDSEVLLMRGRAFSVNFQKLTKGNNYLSGAQLEGDDNWSERGLRLARLESDFVKELVGEKIFNQVSNRIEFPSRIVEKPWARKLEDQQVVNNSNSR